MLKFGGSTLGTPERLRSALDLTVSALEEGPIHVVVSAFSDTTDRLLEACDEAACGRSAAASVILDSVARASAACVLAATRASDTFSAHITELAASTLAPLKRLLAAVADLRDCSPAILDRALGFGELSSAALVSEALRSRGVPALAVDARSWVVTDDRFGAAEVRWGPTRARFEEVTRRLRDCVPVHTGFIGATEDGRPTTLGRNGSDYTATLVARASRAAEVTIWTDVSGVMTADPSIVSESYPVPTLSYREALELSGLGLAMIHSRTMVPLLDAGIPMRIRNAARPDDPGTLVDEGGSADPGRPTCVVSLDRLALVSVEGTHRTSSSGVGDRVLAALARAGVKTHLCTYASRGNGAAVAVDEGHATHAVSALTAELERELRAGDLVAPTVRSPISVVTLVGEAMGARPNVAGRFFGALGAVGVNVLAATQGATSRAISCVVPGADTATAVRAAHAAFNLAHEQVNVLLLGKGVVGGNFLAQLASEGPKLRKEHDLDLRLAGLVDRRASLWSADAIDPAIAKQRLAASNQSKEIVPLLDRLAKLSVPVLVDCTAADGMERVYAAAFERGIHVVAANKKPFALESIARDALFAAAARAHRGLLYETTVGASLPVIATLKNLIRTGDSVRLIEGSFSGTLGFLSNAVTSGERLSEAVRRAHTAGYTEPHPRDDLSGLDAARKALILGRELGLRLSLPDVEVEPFVPAKLLEEDDREAFFRVLEGHDDTFARAMRDLAASGKVLRYLARIVPPSGDGGPGSLRVGPVAVDSHHPAARLRGSEALVAFHTARYDEYPLLVQGAGAGGAVTAAGVLADVLSLSQALRGR